MIHAAECRLENKYRAKGLLQCLALWKLWPPAAGQCHAPPGLCGQLPAAWCCLQVACRICRCRGQRHGGRAPAAAQMKWQQGLGLQGTLWERSAAQLRRSTHLTPLAAGQGRAGPALGCVHSHAQHGCCCRLRHCCGVLHPLRESPSGAQSATVENNSRPAEALVMQDVQVRAAGCNRASSCRSRLLARRAHVLTPQCTT